MKRINYKRNVHRIVSKLDYKGRSKIKGSVMSGHHCKIFSYLHSDLTTRTRGSSINLYKWSVLFRRGES